MFLSATEAANAIAAYIFMGAHALIGIIIIFGLIFDFAARRIDKKRKKKVKPNSTKEYAKETASKLSEPAVVKKTKMFVGKNESPKTLKQFFTTEGKKETEVKEQMKEMRSQLNEIEELRDKINTFEKSEYDPLLAKELKDTLKKTESRVYQNARDVKFCVKTGRSKSKSGSNNIQKEIEREVGDNRRIMDKLWKALSIASQNSIQKDDAFSDMDLNATCTTVQNYISMKRDTNPSPIKKAL